MLAFPERRPYSTVPAACVLDASLRYLTVPEDAAALLGRTAASLVGVSVWDAYPGLEDMAVGKAILRGARTGRPQMIAAPVYGIANVEGAICETTILPHADGTITLVFRFQSQIELPMPMSTELPLTKTR